MPCSAKPPKHTVLFVAICPIIHGCVVKPNVKPQHVGQFLGPTDGSAEVLLIYESKRVECLGNAVNYAWTCLGWLDCVVTYGTIEKHAS